MGVTRVFLRAPGFPLGHGPHGGVLCAEPVPTSSLAFQSSCGCAVLVEQMRDKWENSLKHGQFLL